MAKAISKRVPRGNRLLERLPDAEYQRLLPRLKPIALEPSHVLIKAHSRVEYTYFPVSAVTSFLTVMENGACIEVGTVGSEGVVGVNGALGAPTSPLQVIAQVAGDALRIEAQALEKEVGRSEPFRRVLATYQAAFNAQVSQSVACNGLHPVSKRCCRWLLMTHDRVGSDVMPLTHEYLAMMLGTRRASVTEVLIPLRDRKLISYGRGSITVLNRKGLEAAACECYRAVNAEYNRLFA